MRIKYSEEVDRLAEVIAPYITSDPKTHYWVLRDDAPNDIVEAYEKYCKLIDSETRAVQI